MSRVKHMIASDDAYRTICGLSLIHVMAVKPNTRMCKVCSMILEAGAYQE